MVRIAAALVAGAVLCVTVAPPACGGEVEIRVVDQDTGQPIPARMHLKDQRGKSVLPPKSVAWKDHFVFDGSIVLKLRDGTYQFELERGPEYKIRTGYFTIDRTAKDTKTVTLERFVDMKKEGWWSGELHVHRKLEEIELLMRAEDLHVAPVITWWNDRNPWADAGPPDPLVTRFDEDRWYHVMAGEDERGGGALLYFNLARPLPLVGSQREYPSPVEFLKQSRNFDSVHVDVEKPFWWDVPVWLASGMVHSIGLCNNHQWRDGVLDGEAWGKPRDKLPYPGPLGNGRWSQDIYYHILNCGLRLPPSAGSASGVLANPVGYNRVYVHLGDQPSYESWFAGLRAGRVVVTNGPLLRPLVNGRLPGHVFEAPAGESIELDIALQLSTRDPIDYLEVVRDGKVVHEVRLDEYARRGGRLPAVTFDRSGWMLVRAVTSVPHTYRFASTGPYYVEVGGQQRISKTSAQFFLDWVDERMRQLPLTDPGQRAEVLRYHRAARRFWADKVEQANCP